MHAGQSAQGVGPVGDPGQLPRAFVFEIRIDLRHARGDHQQRRALVGRRDLPRGDLARKKGRRSNNGKGGDAEPARRGLVEAVDERQDRQVLQRQEAGLSERRER